MILTLVLAVLMDICLGEPKKYHPLVGFGNLALSIEIKLYNATFPSTKLKSVGCVAWILMVVPFTAIIYFVNQWQLFSVFLSPMILYFCIAAKSLKQHANNVYQALEANNLDLAQKQVGMIVSRETDKMSSVDVRRATIESVLENGADAVFAPLFWFIIAGPAGAVLYRLSNTLDAMWGYKSHRFIHFGWAAARFDDVLNWIPARLTALSYAVLGQTLLALRCWKNQAYLLDSPNAGPVMTAGAGALDLQLGGSAWYHGKLKNKIYFGTEHVPNNNDINRANSLVTSTLLMWVGVLVVLDFIGAALLEHGGHLIKAAEKYNIPLEQWIDLSTGINPNGWPIPQIPLAYWQRLPETADGLISAAKQYYQCQSILPVAGSQAAIQALPLLRSKSNVGVLTPAYAEHGYSWKKAGQEVIELLEEEIDHQVNQLDVLILINPNNPTAQRFGKQKLLGWHKKLQQHNGWLIIDEAFIDTTPEQSLCHHPVTEGLIILRSIGKFFGLAGIRCGFVIGEDGILAFLDEYLGPWAISNPSRYVATAALTDNQWQQSARVDLKRQSARLSDLLTVYGLKPDGKTDLFHWIETSEAKQIHQSLAKQGVLTRLFNQPSSLRFGLPKEERDWVKLESMLSRIG